MDEEDFSLFEVAVLGLAGIVLGITGMWLVLQIFYL